MKVEVLASTASGSTVVAESNRKRRSGQINLPPPPSHLPLSRLAPLISWREQPAIARCENRRRSWKLIYRSGPPDLLMRYSRGYGQQLSPRHKCPALPSNRAGPLTHRDPKDAACKDLLFRIPNVKKQTDCAVRLKLQQPGPKYGMAGQGGGAGGGVLLCCASSCLLSILDSVPHNALCPRPRKINSYRVTEPGHHVSRLAV